MEELIRQYIDERLGIKDFNLAKKNPDERLHLLNDIIQRVMLVSPSQSLTYTVENRSVTLEENFKHDLGGFCYAVNLKLLKTLQVVGFHCRLHVTDFHALKFRHNFVLVHNVMEAGDVYYADILSGFPTTTAIPLDMQTGGSSKAYVDFPPLGHRISRMGDKYIFQQLNTTQEKSMWEDRFIFKIQPERTEDELLEIHIQDTAKAYNQDYFQRVLNLQRWGKDHCVYVIRNILWLYHKDAAREKIELKNGQQMIAAIQKYFPMLPQDLVETGVKQWCNYNKFPLVSAEL